MQKRVTGRRSRNMVAALAHLRVGIGNSTVGKSAGVGRRRGGQMLRAHPPSIPLRPPQPIPLVQRAGPIEAVAQDDLTPRDQLLVGGMLRAEGAVNAHRVVLEPTEPPTYLGLALGPHPIEEGHGLHGRYFTACANATSRMDCGDRKHKKLDQRYKCGKTGSVAPKLPHPGPLLKAARKRRDLTLEAVAEATGLTAATISRIETEKYRGSPESLERLAEYYGMAPGDLLRGDDHDPAPGDGAGGGPLRTYELTTVFDGSAVRGPRATTARNSNARPTASRPTC